jgi:hypothetical protein
MFLKNLPGLFSGFAQWGCVFCRNNGVKSPDSRYDNQAGKV